MQFQYLFIDYELSVQIHQILLKKIVVRIRVSAMHKTGFRPRNYVVSLYMTFTVNSRLFLSQHFLSPQF